MIATAIIGAVLLLAGLALGWHLAQRRKPADTGPDPQKEAYARLQRSEAMLARAQRIAQLGSWEVALQADGSFGSVTWSDQTWRIFGFQPREMAIDAGAYFERVHPDDRALVQQATLDLIAGTREFGFDHRIVLRDGSLRHVHCEADLLRDAQGRALAILGTVQDITERKRDELVLRRSEERLSAMLENAPSVAVQRYDREGRVRYWNPASSALFGFTAEESLGHTLDQLMLDAAEAQKFQAMILEIERTGEVFGPFETPVVRKDGQQRILMSTTFRIPEPLGGHSFVCMDVDITERKRAELERDNALDNLRRSNRDLQDFAFVASHDLQEPLRKVRAFGGRLREDFAGVLGERGNDHLDRITGAAVRMQRLIEDLLRFSQVTSRSQPFESVDLARIAREVVSDLETSIEAARARVDLKSLPTIEADPTQMRQLFQNLLGNALKFRSEQRTCAVTVSASEIRQDGQDFHRIEFRDNGIGFDQQSARNVFKPFHRLHERGRYEGSGIGLAIVCKIVERHRGQVHAESELGSGSRFCVDLPRQVGVAGSAATEVSKAAESTIGA